MSDMAKQARAAMKAKASKLTSADPHQKVDSSTWTPPEPLNTEVKTGLRPISRRAFKKGGKVMGQKPKANLGKATRGGNKPLTPDNFANKDVKAANEDRAGLKHVGALKTGGRAKKNNGGGTDEIAELIERSNTERSPSASAAGMGNMPLPVPRPKNLGKPESFKSKYDLTTQGKKHGGNVKKAAGGPLSGAEKMMKKAQETGGVPAGGIYGKGFTPTAAGSMSPMAAMGKRTMKKGGTAKHDDVKQDMALIKKMVKPEARKGRDDGGRNYEDAPDYANRSFAFQKESGPRQNQVSEWFKNKELPDVKNMSALERAGTIAKLTGKTLLEGPVRTGAYLMDQAGLKKGGKVKRKGKAGGGGMGALGGLIPMAIGAMGGDDEKSGKKTGGRTKRQTGGGVFSGPGYPGKIPGVVPGGREARATGGKTKGKTNINIIVAAGKPAGEQDMMNPMGGPTRPPGLPVAVPPPQGAAPMPAGMPMPMPPAPAPGPAAAPAGPMPMPRKSGGRLTAKASSYKDMTAGSGGGEGRLQKTDIAEKHKDAPAFKKGGKVYRSYKDMDAGSGSGMGRLEKTEIQSHKR
jgi:hypothetical protein